ncbi:unnamed protein product [Discosporangium mesarthrocarpum]
MPEWGYPPTLLSNRGAQFTAAVAREAYKLIGVEKKFKSAHHPMTDGHVERLNHSVSQALSFE